MDEITSKLLTIGEISKLTNLPIRTLHYYDRIGLFKPAYVDGKTNYRYYTESQIHTIDLIKSLKYIGTSLADIKDAQLMTPEQLLEFLMKQEQVVEEKLRQMQEVQYTLMKTKRLLEEQINIPVLQEVYEMEVSRQRLLAIKSTDATVPEVSDKYFSSLTEIVEREGSVMNTRYGGIYPLKPYNKVGDIRYQYLFTPLLTDRFIDNLNSDVEVHTMPSGQYACIAFYFDLQTYLIEYERLQSYLEDRRLMPQSPVYEVFMPTNYSPEESPAFIVELKVKIKEK